MSIFIKKIEVNVQKNCKIFQFSGRKLSGLMNNEGFVRMEYCGIKRSKRENSLQIFISKLWVCLFIKSGPSNNFIDCLRTAVGLCPSKVFLLDFNVDSVHENYSITDKPCSIDEMIAYLTACEESYLNK